MTYPLMISLGYWILGGLKKNMKEIKRLVGTLFTVSFVIAAFDISSAGILQRYMGDIVFGFIIAATVTLLVLLHKHFEGQMYSWLIKGTYLCVVAGLAFSFLVVITSANGVSLQTYNPQLFYEIASYFKF